MDQTKEETTSIDKNQQTTGSNTVPDLNSLAKEASHPEKIACELEAKKKGPNYTCINIMESIVKDKVKYFHEQFNMCTCERCLTDTSALALSNLPPKYIVAETNLSGPLINVYATKYMGIITTELTKACVKVKEKPHH